MYQPASIVWTYYKKQYTYLTINLMLRVWIEKRFRTNRMGTTTNIQRGRKNILQHQDTSRMLHFFKDSLNFFFKLQGITISIPNHSYLSCEFDYYFIIKQNVFKLVVEFSDKKKVYNWND